jgi:UDPglucose 6-dehydrogenase
MTHLGLCSAMASASKGFATLGFAPDAALIDRLEHGDLPITEPDIADMLRDYRSRIAFSSDPRRLRDCDLIYVAPDVPTDDSGKSDLGSIEAMLDLVIAAIRPDAAVVILSQVPPGFTRGHMRPGLTLLYQVETLVFGRAMERATKPERFIVGCADPAQPLPAAMRSFLEAFGCPILPMRFESAELAKIAINCCLVSSISVANTLAELCEGIGAVWSEIVPALKLDRRIGQDSYLAPGLGIAGGNLERDLATVCRIAEGIGSDDSVVRAWLSNSRHRRDWPLQILRRSVLLHQRRPAIAVLGLAYKENTHSTKNSPAVALLSQLQDYEVAVHDPVVSASAVAHSNLRAAETPVDCCRGADVLVIMTPWPQYRSLDPAELAAAMRGNVIIDPYAVLDPAACRRAGLDLHTLGTPHVSLSKS